MMRRLLSVLLLVSLGGCATYDGILPPATLPSSVPDDPDVAIVPVPAVFVKAPILPEDMMFVTIGVCVNGVG